MRNDDVTDKHEGRTNCIITLLHYGSLPFTSVVGSESRPLQKHVRKVVCGFGKKSCVSTGVRKPGNTYASPTAMIRP